MEGWWEVPAHIIGPDECVSVHSLKLATNPCLQTDSANNIPQTYSAAISIQALGRPLALIPRFFWCLVAFALYTTAAIVGREHFSLILSNVLSVLGYWTSIFVIMILEEVIT